MLIDVRVDNVVVREQSAFRPRFVCRRIQVWSAQIFRQWADQVLAKFCRLRHKDLIELGVLRATLDVRLSQRALSQHA